MPNYLRPNISGARVFFTVALARRGDDLLVRQVDLLRAAVIQVRRKMTFAIAAWVVLPDHLHAIWQLPEGDADYSTRWKGIKREFTVSLGRSEPRSLSKISKGEAGIWQRRFWDHHIRDEADFYAHLHYCWGNPVKHGLVERAVDWPYSSIHRDIRHGLVDPEWSGVAPEGKFGE